MEGGTFGELGIFEASQRLDFGMGLALAAMPAEGEDFGVFGNDSADCRIGAGFSYAFARLTESGAHEVFICGVLASGGHWKQVLDE
jgi:hypothetical protein